MPVYSQEGVCTACKREVNDVLGDHAVGCSSEGERIFRHNIIRDAIFGSAKQSSLSPTKEESALLPGNEGKPADVLIPNWFSGRDAALDISVVSPLQKQLVKKASEETGSAAVKRHNDKLAKYYQRCNEEGIEFLPVVVETLGGWHPEAIFVIKKLAGQLASQTGQRTEETTRHLFQRLSVLLARGNATLIIHRDVNFADPSIDGDLDIDP